MNFVLWGQFPKNEFLYVYEVFKLELCFISIFIKEMVVLL